MSAGTLTSELNSEGLPLLNLPSAVSTDAPQHYLRIEPTPDSAVWARFMEPYLSGVEPLCRSVDLPGGVEMDELFACIPDELIAREFHGPNSRTTLVETPTFAALVQRWTHNNGSFTVRARNRELIERGVATVQSWFPEAEPQTGSVAVDFWQSGSGMYTTSRTIDAPEWDELQQHYPAEVRSELDGLMTTKLDEPDGRVLLWHGPPGTGKTSAIRALAHSWRESARFQIVLDPEPVFSNAANLMQVILNTYDDGEQSNWRVLVIEDADDLVRADNASTSQSLSRLLNVGDGIVGQGLKVLVLLTTNEPPARLHPALTRPGRCLANIAFRRFTSAEAIDAFPDNELVASTKRDLTLAEIMTGRIEPEAAPAPGQYL